MKNSWDGNLTSDVIPPRLCIRPPSHGWAGRGGAGGGGGGIPPPVSPQLEKRGQDMT